MCRHTAGGGANDTIEAAACQWLRETDVKRFANWVHNSDLDGQSGVAAQSHSIITLALVFALSFVLVIMIIVRCFAPRAYALFRVTVAPL